MRQGPLVGGCATHSQFLDKWYRCFMSMHDGSSALTQQLATTTVRCTIANARHSGNVHDREVTLLAAAASTPLAIACGIFFCGRKWCMRGFLVIAGLRSK